MLWPLWISRVTAATYDAANQQLVLGNKSATFDANGNLATLTDPSGMTTYTWNARNQLVSLSGPGVTASFQYDALGRRKSKTVNGVTTEFLYDGHSSVQELSGGSVQANLLLGLGIDEVLQRTEISSTSHFLTDGLGSTLALTDSADAIQTEYTYEPFGTTTINGATSSNASQYTGRENDGTGLYYYRARYYHPGLQRFISQDPIGFAGGDVNLYAYVGNSPVDWIDPFGHAQFGLRDLEGSWSTLPFKHEQLFFEDGKLPRDLGFFPDRVRPDSPRNIDKYEKSGPHYDDALMRKAAERLKDNPGPYCPLLNDCRDWADKVREEYERLKKEQDQNQNEQDQNDQNQNEQEKNHNEQNQDRYE